MLSRAGLAQPLCMGLQWPADDVSCDLERAEGAGSCSAGTS